MHLFLDTETTGLPTRWGAHYTDLNVWPRIVTISWSFYRSITDKLSHRHHIIKPSGFTIPIDATRIHGISTEIANRDGRQLNDILSLLLTDISQFNPNQLICHNVDFDRPVVLAELLRSGIPPHSLEALPTYFTMKSTTDFCALPGGRRGFKFPKLEELYMKLFNRALSGGHNSANDTQACAECYFEFTSLSTRGLTHSSTGLSHRDSWRDDPEASDEAQEMLDTVHAFSVNHPNFDTDFVDSLQNQLDERGFLTAAQLSALKSIISRWRMG